MGLAITRGLLAVENGRIWAEDISSGSRFTIAVPSASRPQA
jgi:signal transduction histidine kinase